MKKWRQLPIKSNSETKQIANIKKSKSKEDGKKSVLDEISVLEKEVEKLTKANAQLMTDLEAAEDEIDHREDTSVKIKDEKDKYFFCPKGTVKSLCDI